jgi:hypothetical protein
MGLKRVPVSLVTSRAAFSRRDGLEAEEPVFLETNPIHNPQSGGASGRRLFSPVMAPPLRRPGTRTFTVQQKKPVLCGCLGKDANCWKPPSQNGQSSPGSVRCCLGTLPRCRRKCVSSILRESCLSARTRSIGPASGPAFLHPGRVGRRRGLDSSRASTRSGRWQSGKSRRGCARRN